MRLGRDAEVRITPNGKQVANLSLVYNYGQKEGDEYPSQWIDAALWGERAERLAPFLLKGSKHLFTIGDVHIETYTDKEGFEAFRLAGRVDDVELGDKRESSGGGESGGQRRQGASPGPAPAPRQQQRAPAPASDGWDDPDRDVPF